MEHRKTGAHSGMPPKEVLQNQMNELSNRQLAEFYGVSLPAIKYWQKKYGLLKWDTFDVNKIFYGPGGSISHRFSIKFIQDIGFLEEFNKLTENFGDEYTIREKIQAIKTSLNSPPKCIKCGKNTHFKEGRFSQYCCQECAHHSKTRHNKISETHLAKDPTIATKKRKLTMLEKYGYETNSQRPECKEGLQKSSLSGEILKKLKDKNWLSEEYITNQRTAIDIGEELKVFYGTILYHLRKNNFDIRANGNYSLYELELRNLISELGIDFEANNRTFIGMELDILIPSKKTAIEFNGLLWHSELYKSRQYHLEKTKRCEKKGVNLIHIFEDDWVQKKEQFVDFIKSKMGVFERRIFGRKCIFKKLDTQEHKFFKENHMQGKPANSKFTFGLFFENEMVGCVSYGAHPRGKKVLVLNRLAFKKGHQIIGGASKLVTTSLRILNVPVISWSDNKWTNGDIYKHLGFHFEKEYKPDYSYYDKKSNTRFAKQNMQKKNIKCPEDMSEREYCLNIGLIRIWDCGKKKWKWNPTQ